METVEEKGPGPRIGVKRVLRKAEGKKRRRRRRKKKKKKRPRSCYANGIDGVGWGDFAGGERGISQKGFGERDAREPVDQRDPVGESTSRRAVGTRSWPRRRRRKKKNGKAAKKTAKKRGDKQTSVKSIDSSQGNRARQGRMRPTMWRMTMSMAMTMTRAMATTMESSYARMDGGGWGGGQKAREEKRVG